MLLPTIVFGSCPPPCSLQLHMTRKINKTPLSLSQVPLSYVCPYFISSLSCAKPVTRIHSPLVQHPTLCRQLRVVSFLRELALSSSYRLTCPCSFSSSLQSFFLSISLAVPLSCSHYRCPSLFICLSVCNVLLAIVYASVSSHIKPNIWTEKYIH